MKITPKYPPSKSCRLAPGTRLRVVEQFTASGVEFRKDEELVFEREMLDAFDGCDAWVFSVPAGPQTGYSEKVISGYEEFSDPKDWLRHFAVIGK